APGGGQGAKHAEVVWAHAALPPVTAHRSPVSNDLSPITNAPQHFLCAPVVNPLLPTAPSHHPYLAPMRLLLPLVLCLAAVSCAAPEPASLCDRFFTPYPDLVSQRPRTTRNAALLDAMAHYAQQDYAVAAERLQQVVDRDPRDITARIYLVNALLASGDPYRAEMHLDFMENHRDRSYSDQV